MENSESRKRNMTMPTLVSSMNAGALLQELRQGMMKIGAAADRAAIEFRALHQRMDEVEAEINRRVTW